MTQVLNMTTPVGRIVMGDFYEPRTQDAEGKPLVFKNGPNVGKPREDYWFALAIQKQGERAWWETPWGLKIWQVGSAAFPQASQSPDFAWKITDGDSTVKNKKGNAPCDREGHKGHWILFFSGGYKPKVFQQQNGAFIQVEEGFMKPGYYAEINFDVVGNGSAQNPGIYMNHRQVCFRGYGEEINFGPTPEQAGFGQSPLPAGASAVPLAGQAMPTPPAAGPAGMPAMPPAASPAGMPSMPPVPGAAAMPSMPAPTNVAPNLGFTQMPPAATPPAAPPVASAPGRTMTALAAGVTYEAFIAKGWTDAALIQHGYMQA